MTRAIRHFMHESRVNHSPKYFWFLVDKTAFCLLGIIACQNLSNFEFFCLKLDNFETSVHKLSALSSDCLFVQVVYMESYLKNLLGNPTINQADHPNYENVKLSYVTNFYVREL